MEALSNVPSADAYNDTNTLLQPGSGTLEMLVANNAIIIRLNMPTGTPGKYQWSPELFVGPSISARTFQDVGGVQFRSALAGSAALVSAVLYTQDEALSISTSAFTSTVSPSGGVSPPPPTTGTLNFDHNGIAVGTEATLDVVDAAAVGNPTNPPITWLAVDTPGSKVAYTPVFKLGVQHNDAGQLNEAVLDLQDQATFPALTWAVTDDAAHNRVQVKPTISGVLAVLADSGVLGAPAANIDFQSIPATYMELMLVWYGRTSAAVVLGQLAIRFNNDSGANYSDASYYTNDPAVTGFTTLENLSGQSSGSLGAMLGTSAGSAVNMGSGVIHVPGYAGTTFQKNAIADYYVPPTGANTQQDRGFAGCLWQSSAAINRVTIFPRSGNFVAGSRAVLYGL